MISNALEDQPLPVYGDGQNIRDWIHVDDHCRAIELAILKGIPGEIYNVGAGCEVRNLDLVKAVLRVLGKPESLIKFVPDRLGHDRRYAIDARKIERELNWKPKYRLLEVLPDIIDWYEKNESWWRSCLLYTSSGLPRTRSTAFTRSRFFISHPAPIL